MNKHKYLNELNSCKIHKHSFYCNVDILMRIFAITLICFIMILVVFLLAYPSIEDMSYFKYVLDSFSGISVITGVMLLIVGSLILMDFEYFHEENVYEKAELKKHEEERKIQESIKNKIKKLSNEEKEQHLVHYFLITTKEERS